MRPPCPRTAGTIILVSATISIPDPSCAGTLLIITRSLTYCTSSPSPCLSHLQHSVTAPVGIAFSCQSPLTMTSRSTVSCWRIEMPAAGQAQLCSVCLPVSTPCRSTSRYGLESPPAAIDNRCLLTESGPTCLRKRRCYRQREILRGSRLRWVSDSAPRSGGGKLFRHCVGHRSEITALTFLDPLALLVSADAQGNVSRNGFLRFLLAPAQHCS